MAFVFSPGGLSLLVAVLSPRLRVPALGQALHQEPWGHGSCPPFVLLQGQSEAGAVKER